MMDANPWKVDSIEAFSFLNCPECPFRTKEENFFGFHAARNHPLSFAFFGKQMEQEQLQIGVKMLKHSPVLNELKMEEEIFSVKEEEKIFSVKETSNSVNTSEGMVVNSDNPTTESDRKVIVEVTEESKCSSVSLDTFELWKAYDDRTVKTDQEYHITNLTTAALEEKILFDGTVDELNKNLDDYHVIEDFQDLNAPERDIGEKVDSIYFDEKRFKCSICEQCFETASDLEKHIENVHDGKNRNKCQVFDNSVSKENDSKAQVSSIHDEKEPFECTTCGKNLFAKTNLLRHITDEHPLKCSKCDQLLDKKILLKRHMITVHDEKKKYFCNICDLKFLLKQSLKKHLVSVHNKPIKVYDCSICSDSFMNQDRLTKHRRNVHHEETRNVMGRPMKASHVKTLELVKTLCGNHSVNEMSLMLNINYCTLKEAMKRDKVIFQGKESECHLCEMKKSNDLISKDVLFQFMKFNNEHKAFKCTICDFTTRKRGKRGSMFTHIKSLHKDEIIASHNSKIENKYDCGNSECKAFYGRIEGKKFWCTKCASLPETRKRKSEIKEKPTDKELCTDCGITVQNLNVHIDNVHNAEKQTCPQCGKELKSLMYLYAHIREIHEKKPCAQCGKLYGATAMTRHIASAHIPRNQSKFKCEVCGKGFVSTQTLKDHNNIHTGEKPYKCELCTACFASRGTQVMHQRRHLGVPRRKKPQKCTECGVTFTNLQQHIDSVHLAEKQICPQCGKEFKKHSLRGHMKTEHDKEPCTVCGKLFGAKRMKKHIHSAHTPKDQK